MSTVIDEAICLGSVHRRFTARAPCAENALWRFLKGDKVAAFRLEFGRGRRGVTVLNLNKGERGNGQDKTLAIDPKRQAAGIVGGFDGRKLTLRETSRFTNEPVMLETGSTGIFWVLHEIKDYKAHAMATR